MNTQAKPICPQCESPLTTAEEIKHNACESCWNDFINDEDISIDHAVFYDL